MALLECVLEHNPHKYWWEEGWQKFLDPLYKNDQIEEMETYIQQAYDELTRMKYEVPSPNDYWGECLKGLGIYTTRLRLRRASLAGSVPDADDNKGWPEGSVDFSKHWS